MHVLYTMDICKTDKSESEKYFWTNRQINNRVVAFSKELVDGTVSNLEEINKLLAETADNWEITRMTSVDRAILRLAVYELMYTPQTPSKVVINEAIELAKEYSTEHSGRFVNGILDKINKLKSG